MYLRTCGRALMWDAIMHRLLPLGIALAFVGVWLGFVPVSAGEFECGSVYRPKSLSTDLGPNFPGELLGPAQDAFGSTNQACARQRTQLVALPMAAVIVAGIGAAVAGGLAWRRGKVLASAAE
ncbi:hypothetical protein [Actinomadura sp. WMMA1423]|uniref:hypothetical protein n=1 Tax=Actinomadura sp. WMMA1423 TaxID=2591108 RepID=UPI001147058F|nr:hypothetical protein [Actinomadura sp. WMMA1423]